MSFINYNYLFNTYNCGWIIEWVYKAQALGGEGAPDPGVVYKSQRLIKR